jgi:hypothetical protein
VDKDLYGIGLDEIFEVCGDPRKLKSKRKRKILDELLDEQEREELDFDLESYND